MKREYIIEVFWALWPLLVITTLATLNVDVNVNVNVEVEVNVEQKNN